MAGNKLAEPSQGWEHAVIGFFLMNAASFPTSFCIQRMTRWHQRAKKHMQRLFSLITRSPCSRLFCCKLQPHFRVEAEPQGRHARHVCHTVLAYQRDGPKPQRRHWQEVKPLDVMIRQQYDLRQSQLPSVMHESEFKHLDIDIDILGGKAIT